MLSVVGDSHAGIFNRVSDEGLLPRTWLDVLSVPAATAFGLANPNSSTNALTRFSEFLDRTPPPRRTIFMLGEVDCGFVIWHRSMTRGTTVETEFAESLQRYTTFLDDAMARGHEQIGILSVAPPTIADYATWKGLGNARHEVTSSIEARTALTVAYNRELEAWAGRTSATFIDLDPDLIDPSTGLVASRFVNPDPTDHHLAPEPLAELLGRRISAASRRLVTSRTPGSSLRRTLTSAR